MLSQEGIPPDRRENRTVEMALSKDIAISPAVLSAVASLAPRFTLGDVSPRNHPSFTSRLRYFEVCCRTLLSNSALTLPVVLEMRSSSC
jgi:hypothetical protein